MAAWSTRKILPALETIVPSSRTNAPAPKAGLRQTNTGGDDERWVLEERVARWGGCLATFRLQAVRLGRTGIRHSHDTVNMHFAHGAHKGQSVKTLVEDLSDFWEAYAQRHHATGSAEV